MAECPEMSTQSNVAPDQIVTDDCEFEKSDESKMCILLLKNAYGEKKFNLADEIIEDMVSKSLVKGLTKLHTACGYGLVELVERYLKIDRMDPNALCSFNDLNNIAPIHFCAGIGPDPLTNNRHKCIEVLVQNGALVNALTTRNDSALHWATKLGDLATCEALIKCGADVNLINIDNCTCAHGAAYYKNIPILELLIKNNVNVLVKDVSGKNILHLLCKDNDQSGLQMETEMERQNHEEKKFFKLITMLLEEYKMDCNETDLSACTPFMYACEQQNLELLKILLDHKANLNLINSEGVTCMVLAIINSCPKVVDFLLKNGFDLNTRHPNCSYVTDAAYLNSKEILLLLLDAGCSADETREDENGVILNPLWAACERSNTQIVELLLQRGANPVIKAEFNMTALHCTAMAQYENLQIAKLLVDYQCPINLKSSQAGETPLFLACNSGFCEMVEYLVSLGVDVNDCSPMTRTCFQQAIFRSHKDIIMLLLNKGYVLTNEDKNDLNLLLMDLYQENDVEMLNYLLDKNLTSKQAILECIKNVHTWNMDDSTSQTDDASLVATLTDLKLDFSQPEAQIYPKTIEELNAFLDAKQELGFDSSDNDEVK
ncbi:ankyrin repeat [Brachionus plicatilis]|uniref:Ankyrin repeat n=1 Tax=Brachionus plicatilis TaxID=10195 RepID=A0A3M7Q4F4_BRAPC|nr:ankyrin repeat [Brachionus plicatilis]